VKPLQNWQIESSDGKAVIAIPACDADWANVAVFYKDSFRRYQRGGHVQHAVGLPSLKFELNQTHYPDMRDDTYRSYLDENKSAILALAARLNAGSGDGGRSSRQKNKRRER
jgi:hypothetical protein